MINYKYSVYYKYRESDEVFVYDFDKKRFIPYDRKVSFHLHSLGESFGTESFKEAYNVFNENKVIFNNVRDFTFDYCLVEAPVCYGCLFLAYKKIIQHSSYWNPYFDFKFPNIEHNFHVSVCLRKEKYKMLLDFNFLENDFEEKFYLLYKSKEMIEKEGGFTYEDKNGDFTYIFAHKYYPYDGFYYDRNSPNYTKIFEEALGVYEKTGYFLAKKKITDCEVKVELKVNTCVSFHSPWRRGGYETFQENHILRSEEMGLTKCTKE